MRSFSTAYQLGNGHYPSLAINWFENEDRMGFHGNCNIWTDGNTKIDCGNGHTVSVREGNPIGSISFYLDEVVYGCWRMGMIEGTEITKRDLQLITAWAALAIESKHLAHGYGCKVIQGCKEQSDGGTD